MFATAVFGVALAFLPRVFAHGGVLYYSNGGSWYDGFKAYNSPSGQSTIQRPWATYNPIVDANDPTLACNNDGTNPSGQLTATVAAGSKITAFWNEWPHDTGPMLVYLAKCPGSTCTGVNSNTLSWFKIDHSGLLSGTVAAGTWASGQMIAQNNSWTTTIPSTVPPGAYLIRHETIALHLLPAQFYPECAQIQITGSGSRAPLASELTTFPGGYKSSDPGLSVDLYGQAAKTQTTYVIPGPPLYGSGSTGGGGTSQPPSTPPPATSVSTSSAPAQTGTVAQYGQCGGTGYSGPTACKSPYTCTKLNDYYSQCT
ncbi:hypothetical protein HGRIS_003214 [Hohenbuehelia grisea]|uniref:AA9 family lytic polysaccharide monooxygenase n=1 Tax=Hohenbuehelia grisea TaxID=104357 RepID=A0ABR3JN10_9AGAR